jgi:taurine dioxygenase
MSLTITPAAAGIGAEISGVDVNTLTEPEFGRIYQAFLDHLVLVVRGQTLTIERFLAYSARFGTPVPHITKKTRHPEYPALTVMGRTAVVPGGSAGSAVLKRGEGWHTDTAFLPQPCKATQLYAVQLPSYGGDTLFANMYSAYEALPPALQQRVDGLKATFRCGGKEQATLALLDEEERNRPPVIHSIVRVHPETGRKALYVNPVHILGIVGMSPTESDAFLAELFGMMVVPNCDYRHKWQRGDLVIWDNRCTIHSAAGGYPADEPRIHWRTTIMEDNAHRPNRSLNPLPGLAASVGG